MSPWLTLLAFIPFGFLALICPIFFMGSVKKPLTDRELLAKLDAGEIDPRDILDTLRARG